MGKEKRRQERLSARMFVQLSSPDGEDLGRGVVIDVSLGGIAVETETNMDLGKEYSFDIEIPFHMKAIPVRSQRNGNLYRYGLVFKDLSFWQKFLFKSLLKGKRETAKI